MDGKIIALAKMREVEAGRAVVMSDAELEWLIDNELLPLDVVSIPNPQQVGILDARMVAKKTHPLMRAERQTYDTLTSATRAPVHAPDTTWDEPKGAISPRGWYWPKGSTCPGKTVCAGHYLDYGPDHYRYDSRKDVEPGHIHCVVIAKDSGTTAASRYVETVEEAREWIEAEASKVGHMR